MAPATTGTFHRVVPASSIASRMLRGDFSQWLTATGVAQDGIDDMVLVAGELFANAVHATTGAAPVDVHAVLGLDLFSGDSDDADPATNPAASAARMGIIITVINDGSGFDPEAVRMPPPSQPGGRGIAIAKALGRLSVAQEGQRTVVSVAMSVA